MSALNSRDLNRCVARLPDAVVTAMTEAPGRVFVAGGFVRCAVTGEEIADVDLFVPTSEEAAVLAAKLGGPMALTDNATTLLGFNPPIQIIRRWAYATAEDLIAAFDFTIAAAAVWNDGTGWRSVCHADYYADVAARRLVYLRLADNTTGGSLNRAFKFARRGYHIPAESLGDLVADVAAPGSAEVRQRVSNRLAEARVSA